MGPLITRECISEFDIKGVTKGKRDEVLGFISRELFFIQLVKAWQFKMKSLFQRHLISNRISPSYRPSEEFFLQHPSSLFIYFDNITRILQGRVTKGFILILTACGLLEFLVIKWFYPTIKCSCRGRNVILNPHDEA